MIHYKGFKIIRKDVDGRPWAIIAESSSIEKVTFSTCYEGMIELIDFLFDGKEPEGYFQKY